jgi:SAM-dependent methyltransferase
VIRVVSDRPRSATEATDRESTLGAYDHIARFYEFGVSGFDDDLGLYLGFAQRGLGSILELGCGSGRLLLPLARAGCPVVGVDSSAAMLDLARTRLSSFPEFHVGLVQADMCHLPLAGRFGLIFVALDGFLHLTSRDEQLGALRAARTVLEPRGVLVLDLPAPGGSDWGDWSAGVRPLVPVWSASIQDGSRVSKLSTFSADASAQTHLVTETYEQVERDGGVRKWVVEYLLRFVFPGELELLLEMAGFRLLERYGDYDLEPFGASSPRQICVAAAESVKQGQ